jgi:hypothetical protein
LEKHRQRYCGCTAKLIKIYEFVSLAFPKFILVSIFLPSYYLRNKWQQVFALLFQYWLKGVSLFYCIRCRV